MAVICFGSLKGGVGKTSMSVNVAHAFATRGCETLIIDLDPMAHASRFFRHRVYNNQGRLLNGSAKHSAVDETPSESPLARLFLASEFDETQSKPEAVVECAINSQISLIRPVRERLALLPSGPELRHFLWGRGARVFRSLFPRLIAALECSYDYIVIDTPPDFNVLTRNAIASADLAVVPVDSSAMSIHCLEEMIAAAQHIRGPMWLIARTMVSRKATRVQRLASDRLGEKLDVRAAENVGAEENDREASDPFVALMGESHGTAATQATTSDADPIFLLNSVVHRREQQNRLTFLGRTAFDGSEDQVLRESYHVLARELEQMLALRTGLAEPEMPASDFSQLSALGFQ